MISVRYLNCPLGFSRYAVRRYSSIFDVLRERKSEALVHVPCRSENESMEHHGYGSSESVLIKKSDSHLGLLLKQFQNLRMRTVTCEDLIPLRVLSIETMQNLSQLKSEDIWRISEILAHAKYRNAILMQGLSETLYWQTKLGKIKLLHITGFLKSACLLKYVPKMRHLTSFIAELNNSHHRIGVGDYLRTLQFLVHCQLSDMDIFMDLYYTCYQHCINNLGYMKHSQLASFSQVQLVVEPTDGEVFDRICLNFQREIESSESVHFLMISNSILCSKLQKIPPNFNMILSYYVTHKKDKCTTKMTLAALRCAKCYHRNMECLNKIGIILSDMIPNMKHNEIINCLNDFASLNYKHKELVKGVVSKINSSEFNLNSPLYIELVAALSNYLCKVRYIPIPVLELVTKSCVKVLEHQNGEELYLEGNSKDIDSGFSDSNTINEVKSKTNILTCNDILDTFPIVSSQPEPVHLRRYSLRRYYEHHTRANVNSSFSDYNESEYLPLKIVGEIRKHRSMKECMNAFYTAHFNGVHPALRRIEMRKRMANIITNKCNPKSIYNKSNANKSVYLERINNVKMNRSFKKIKKQIRSSRSRHVQASMYHINESKVLMRCFLYPYKKILTIPKDEAYSQQLVKSTNANHSTLLNAISNYYNALVQIPSYRYPFIDNGANVRNVNSQEDDYKLKVADYKIQELVNIMDNFIHKESPIYFDNGNLMKPHPVSSLYSSRVRKYFYNLQRMDSFNQMNRAITYMRLHGLFEFQNNQGKANRNIKSIQHLCISIATAVHKLGFTSFELLDKLSMMIQQNKIDVYNNLKYGHYIKHLVDSIESMLIRDRSFIICSRLFEAICTHICTFRKALNVFTSGGGIQVQSILYTLNKLIFIKYDARDIITNKDNGKQLNSTNLLEIHSNDFILYENSLKALHEILIEKDLFNDSILNQLHLFNNLLYSQMVISKALQSPTLDTNGVHTHLQEYIIKNVQCVAKLANKISSGTPSIDDNGNLMILVAGCLKAYELTIGEYKGIKPEGSYEFFNRLKSPQDPIAIAKWTTKANVASKNCSIMLDGSTKHAQLLLWFTFAKISIVTYKGETCPMTYVIHKILGILKQQPRPFHTLEVEKALRNLGFSGVDICTNKELYTLLQKVKRIHFDTERKRLVYRNPYDCINSLESLVHYISKNACVKGLKVNEELLSAHPRMQSWINEILRARKVRGIRLNSSNVKGKKKCRHAGTMSQCTLYTASKCQECVNNIQGVALFPLGKENFEHERFKLDHDIKSLWDSVALLPIDSLLKEYNMGERVIAIPQNQLRKRRGGRQQTQGPKPRTKMRRIYNTHLFTPQELRTGLLNVTQAPANQPAQNNINA
ncbi:hypothetical protein BdWA1_002731 [Babesia duncani]|uniref:Uncharacterized protein n=1 Tax=Babesia duncani TaxID=323732 RepID=A0AAD9PKA6_9APIC|nr:hypothetical protein BdWA1_002731 [Babesia duncani]